MRRNTFPGQRFDERDTIFSRMHLEPGSSRYRAYYRDNPDKWEIDEEFRSSEPGLFSDRMPQAAMVESTFDLIRRLRPLAQESPDEYRRSVGLDENRDAPPGPELTALLKQQARRYGMVLAEAVIMEERFYYSVRGRGKRYGEPIDKMLPTAFVTAVLMDKDEIVTAPSIREAVEVANAYLRVAVPALALAASLRSLGYEALAHIDGESEVVLTPLARKAGFGKIGRHGLLVSKTYGSLLRISAVTTDAPLKHGSAGGDESFPLEKACEVCRRCAEFCPSSAIPAASIIDNYEEEVRKTDHEACFKMWRKFGTDCGVCLAVCPYTKGAASGKGKAESGKGPASPEPGAADFLKKYMF